MIRFISARFYQQLNDRGIILIERASGNKVGFESSILVNPLTHLFFRMECRTSRRVSGRILTRTDSSETSWSCFWSTWASRSGARSSRRSSARPRARPRNSVQQFWHQCISIFHNGRNVGKGANLEPSSDQQLLVYMIIVDMVSFLMVSLKWKSNNN